jgi:hypothetical protein
MVDGLAVDGALQRLSEMTATFGRRFEKKDPGASANAPATVD